MTRVPVPIAERLRDELHAQCFTPIAGGAAPRIGAEVEFLVVAAASRRPIALDGPRTSLLRLLRSYATSTGWCEGRTSTDTPRFDIPGRAIITFEPGGQIEISTIACASPNALLDTLESIVPPLREHFAESGVELLAAGIDPVTRIECVPLQLHVERYERMTHYFDGIGPFGARMMRQTAATQISLDRGPRPADRWRLLNNLAPFLVAMFANSPRYAGEETGHRSYRAHCWRMLDVTRTGIVAAGGDPAREYASFALAANDMMREDADGAFRPFGDWIAAGDWDAPQWTRHLTTLFPEVRPRGHFEVRSCDAIAPTWYPALVVFLSGLVYDATSAAEADAIVSGSRDVLGRAGRCGLADPAIARVARDLARLALDGAARLPADYLSPEHVDRARDVFANCIDRALSPADLDGQLLIGS